MIRVIAGIKLGRIDIHQGFEVLAVKESNERCAPFVDSVFITQRDVVELFIVRHGDSERTAADRRVKIGR